MTSISNHKNRNVSTEALLGHSKIQDNSKKKKAGKVISLADAARGSVVFQQGKPCSCQARKHRLVSNCLSCGKIVCEQEGEGPCSFCGALVLKEGSTYAGLEEDLLPPLSVAEMGANAYARRLVEYDRNSAARTTVIDDQSDYYEIASNSWLSNEEKEMLKKKQQQIEEAEEAKKKKVVITFDLVGRKVLLNQDDLETNPDNRFLRAMEEQGRDVTRIKPNPSLSKQPIFVDPGPSARHMRAPSHIGVCLAVTGRVQHSD